MHLKKAFFARTGKSFGFIPDFLHEGCHADFVFRLAGKSPACIMQGGL
ncbi:hypothetical protein BCO26_1237 [Heyndrickxia coagulans 2-6]|nr:hypothetical protein BCO26_1237 [Heyndrickxia coagulans 2-6]